MDFVAECVVNVPDCDDHDPAPNPLAMVALIGAAFLATSLLVANAGRVAASWARPRRRRR